MKETKIAYPELERDKITSNKNGLVTFWRLLSGYHGHYLLSALLLAVSAASRTGMYLYLGYFIDQILGKVNPSSSCCSLHLLSWVSSCCRLSRAF